MTVSISNAYEVHAVRAALESDYEVLDELGRGGMAIVFKAKERSLDREVAIKVLPATLALDAEFVERFQREAKTAGQLEHPNIVPIYRVGRSGSVIFFVMKILPGQSLSAVLRERGRLAASDIRRILIETASALNYAAKRGVVHRDIKPDNIMLDSEGRCVVTDFGIAKVGAGNATAPGTSMGTPRYMSPEHAQGTPVDGRSDIYSLGVVAYQCLAGSVPFDGEDPFAVLYKHINAPIPRPNLASEDDVAIFNVIEKMMAKNPDDRYQSGDELISALGGQASGTITLVGTQMSLGQAAFQPTEIIPTPLGIKLKRAMSKDPRVWAGAAALVVVAGLGVWAALPSASAAADSSAANVAAQGSKNPVPGAPGGITGPALGVAAVVTDSAKTAGATTGATPVASNTKALATKTATTTAPAPRRVPPPPYSTCPARPSPGTLALRVDSIRTQKRDAKLAVNYDVCGLNEGAAISAEINVRRLNQPRFGRKTDPINERFAADAINNRSRHRYIVDLRGLPPGEYALGVMIRDKEGRTRDIARNFIIVEK
jgi:predicted Ser/Thr protein kinase